MRFFFYGTLLAPEVRELVIGHPIELTSAMLTGWHRFRVAEKVYPVILPDPGGEVAGGVTPPLSPREIDRLQAYEGPTYRTEPVAPVLAGGDTVAAMVFLASGEVGHAGEWEFDAWRHEHLADWVARLQSASAGQHAPPRADRLRGD
jgi:hypothetical protein